jgi:alpha-L-arabinofuranosidase
VNGITHAGPKGTATVLTASKLADENSLDEPRKVSPVSERITVPGSKFPHTFPAQSLTVLRWSTKP